MTFDTCLRWLTGHQGGPLLSRIWPQCVLSRWPKLLRSWAQVPRLDAVQTDDACHPVNVPIENFVKLLATVFFDSRVLPRLSHRAFTNVCVPHSMDEDPMQTFQVLQCLAVSDAACIVTSQHLLLQVVALVPTLTSTQACACVTVRVISYHVTSLFACPTLEV